MTTRTERDSRACPAPAPLALEVRGVSVRYSSAGREIDALTGVSLCVNSGELVGLFGPNGSGKTTLVRAVTGSVVPRAGRVLLLGDEVGRLSQREIALRAAVVPQDPALPPMFTALDCVLMGRTPHLRLLQKEGRADLHAARRAMLATDTFSLADRPLGELSGGERQRVVIARALAQETALLLLDEPTAHLDIGHQAAVLRLMQSLCRSEGKAVIAVVHDLTLAAQFCDRLIMLSGGRIVAQGPAAEVLRPELLAQVYRARVDVLAHPATGRPVVAPSTEGG